MGIADVTTRPATPKDAEAVTEVFLTSRQTTMPYLPRVHSDDETRWWVTNIMLPESTVWVAAADARIVGFCALNGTELEHLYLRPEWLRQGIGTTLLKLATEQSPRLLELKVFQRNENARAFYERHGFVAIDSNDGSRNEENEPDMTYRWAPLVEFGA
ncbi:GNAT family N-acetyltransferase [Amycolatopsis coloradensis]|uniref:GNAT family N-acetyltransferase n=1 Tax=Amycolatopsis coloradensis TaxID=76021 RepID=A0A1R0KH80_9PSEU|nr:GNAT family N-acetyltransferase [Amycolatopsis coloradensis]OLZ45025.1 GNAT family N-acetyltransferase [Amycolatopsis coloradensis]